MNIGVSMKKLMNGAENIVVEMCKGFVLAHPELAFNESYKIVSRKQKHQNVALISGGGSGHEPAHAGFVGTGMLDAAVCGDVFASPSQIQIYKALTQVATEKGVLMIIKNYSGDMMNFQNGAALATEDGIKVDYVKVADDIAVKDSLYTVGRRGVAGTVFVHKIAGAAASQGYDLTRVKALAQKAADNVTSLGFAFTSCTVPAKGTPTFTLAEDEMEYGVGIHGEPGIRREKILPSKKLAQRVVDDLFLDRPELNEVAVMINGFGTTPLQELYVFNQDVCQHLQTKGIKVYRTFVGNFMTSIDMAGASVSLLALDDELKTYLDAEANTPALKMDGSSAQALELANQNIESKQTLNINIETHPEHASIVNEQFTIENMRYVVDVMSACIIKNEVPFCDLDAHAGDGDFGMSVAKGFKQLKRQWHELLQDQHMDDFLRHCSMIIMEYCGGASGPIWGSAFRAASKSIKGKTTLSVADFALMLQDAIKGIQITGERSFGRGAVVGDKTLIDALVPCADSWSAHPTLSFKENFSLAAQAAVQGAESTKNIVARMGRAGTVGDRSLGYPDAGAYGLGVIFTEISDHIK